MSKNPYPSETADRYIIRFPDGMRERIKELAEKNGRSMNAEIIARLEESLGHKDVDLWQHLVRLEKRQAEQHRIILAAFKALGENGLGIDFSELEDERPEKD